MKYKYDYQRIPPEYRASTVKATSIYNSLYGKPKYYINNKKTTIRVHSSYAGESKTLAHILLYVHKTQLK